MNLDPLFTPYTINKTVIRNRFAMAPMQRFTPADYIPSPEFIEDYRRRVEGGVGLIITQGTTMDHWTTGMIYARFFPPAYDAWARCADAIRNEGGQVFMQFVHEGSGKEGGYGPSGLNTAGVKMGHALSKDMIKEFIDLYAHSSRMAQKLGFSGVELHGGHGGLIDQFFYDESNKRDDEYGGDLTGRARFGAEVVKAIRQTCGSDFPISMRISQWKGNNYHAQTCKTPDDIAQLTKPLKEAGLDILHASTRRFWQPEWEGSDLGYAGWVKKMSGMPTMAVGSVGLDIDMHTTFSGTTAHSTGVEGLSELLRRFNRGDFDMVTVGRAVLTDADWVKKVQEGRFDDLMTDVTSQAVKGTIVINSYKIPEDAKQAKAG